MNPTLQEIIEPLLNSKYTAKDIKPENKIQDLFQDRLAGTALLFEIEQHTGIFISDNDFQKMKTVGDLEAYIQKYRPTEKCASQ